MICLPRYNAQSPVCLTTVLYFDSKSLKSFDRGKNVVCKIYSTLCNVRSILSERSNEQSSVYIALARRQSNAPVKLCRLTSHAQFLAQNNSTQLFLSAGVHSCSIHCNPRFLRAIFSRLSGRSSNFDIVLLRRVLFP